MASLVARCKAPQPTAIGFMYNWKQNERNSRPKLTKHHPKLRGGWAVGAAGTVAADAVDVGMGGGVAVMSVRGTWR